jgi:DNA replication protein DnaC
MDSFDFGPEPMWLKCSGCGVETMREMCRACADADDARRSYARACDAVGIPCEFAWANLSNAELLRRVRLGPGRTIESASRAILEAKNATLVGQAGSGKTSLLVACLRETMPDALFVTSDELAHAAIRTKAGSGEPEIQVRANRVRTLLIDEVKAAHTAAHHSLVAVLEHRWNHGLSTWITTGMQRAELRDAFGEGIERRLFGERNFALRLMPAAQKLAAA